MSRGAGAIWKPVVVNQAKLMVVWMSGSSAGKEKGPASGHRPCEGVFLHSNSNEFPMKGEKK